MAKTATEKSLRNLQLLGFASFAAMMGAFAVWSLLANINGAVIAPATIVAESYSKKVQHREGGNVLKIMVRDGDVVQAGQDLVLLDPTETNAELSIIQGEMNELLVKKARLEVQRDGGAEIVLPASLQSRLSDENFAAIVNGQQKLLQSTLQGVAGKQEQFKSQIGQLQDQIKGIDAQLAGGKKQLDLINIEANNLRKLQKQGLVPVSRINAMDRDAAQIQGSQGNLVANKAAALSKISEVKLQALQVTEELRNQALSDTRDVESKLVEMQGRNVAANARLTRLSIKAPITGTVYQMAVHTEGGVVAPNEPLMLILPEKDDLVLQAQITPNDIDHVHLGQPAEIVFPAFDTRVTPRISAEVTQVAADTTKPDGSKAEGTQPFYAVRLTISAKELEKLGANKLKPGMGAEAFIQTESRSPFSYLVGPLVQQWSHAMRES